MQLILLPPLSFLFLAHFHASSNFFSGPIFCSVSFNCLHSQLRRSRYQINWNGFHHFSHSATRVSNTDDKVHQNMILPISHFKSGGPESLRQLNFACDRVVCVCVWKPRFSLLSLLVHFTPISFCREMTMEAFAAVLLLWNLSRLTA